MSVLYLLVPLAISLVAVFVGLYVWSARTGQFDDLVTPAMRILHDEVAGSKEEETNSKATGTREPGRKV